MLLFVAFGRSRLGSHRHGAGSGGSTSQYANSEHSWRCEVATTCGHSTGDAEGDESSPGTQVVDGDVQRRCIRSDPKVGESYDVNPCVGKNVLVG